MTSDAGSMCCRRSAALEEHVDTGLFNIVIGTLADLSPLHFRLDGADAPLTPLRDLLRGGAAQEPLGGTGSPPLHALVIPGYTLQLLDDGGTRAVLHTGEGAAEAYLCAERVLICLSAYALLPHCCHTAAALL